MSRRWTGEAAPCHICKKGSGVIGIHISCGSLAPLQLGRDRKEWKQESPPPYLCCFPSCLYTIDLRLWISKDKCRCCGRSTQKVVYGEVVDSTPQDSSTKKERRVITTGDSLLRGMEGPVCQPDPTCTEVWETPQPALQKLF